MNSWLAIRVANSEGRWVAVPKLATFLLDALPLMDGHTAVAPELGTIEDFDRFVATASKDAREGKVYVDYLRNGRNATAIGMFSPRAIACASSATANRRGCWSTRSEISAGPAWS